MVTVIKTSGQPTEVGEGEGGSGGWALIQRVDAISGTVPPNDTQTIATFPPIENISGEAFVSFQLVVNIPMALQAGAIGPGNHLFAQLELLVDDVPVSPDYAITQFNGAVTGDIQFNMVGLSVQFLTDADPHTFSLKLTTGANTTAVFGTEGGTFPNAGFAAIYANPEEVSI